MAIHQIVVDGLQRERALHVESCVVEERVPSGPPSARVPLTESGLHTSK
jgi:hypothetical protein